MTGDVFQVNVPEKRLALIEKGESLMPEIIRMLCLCDTPKKMSISISFSSSKLKKTRMRSIDDLFSPEKREKLLSQINAFHQSKPQIANKTQEVTKFDYISKNRQSAP